MKIKVISAQKDTYWYADHIGDIFEVKPAEWIEFSDGERLLAHYVTGDEESSFIEWKDCLEVTDEKYMVVCAISKPNLIGSFDEAVRRAGDILNESPTNIAYIVEPIAEVTTKKEYYKTVIKRMK